MIAVIPGSQGIDRAIEVGKGWRAGREIIKGIVPEHDRHGLELVLGGNLAHCAHCVEHTNAVLEIFLPRTAEGRIPIESLHEAADTQDSIEVSRVAVVPIGAW